MDKHEKELIELYKKLEDEIKAAIESGTNNKSSTFHKQLTEKVNKIFSEHNAKASEWVQSSVTNLYKGSKDEVDKSMKDALKMSDDEYDDAIKLSQKKKDELESKSIQKIVDDKNAQIKFANSTLQRNIVGAIKDNAKEKGKRQKDIAKSLKEDIYSQDGDGRISIKCRDGKVRKYDPQKYAETVAKQAEGETRNTAALNQSKELGTEIMEMSSHSPTCKICAKLQGRWYSLNKENEDYPYIHDTAWKNGKTVHPGCRHTFRPVLLDNVDEATKKKMMEESNRPFEESSEDEKMLKQYYEDQKKKAKLTRDKDSYDELLNMIDEDDLPSFDDYVKIKEEGGEEWKRIKQIKKDAEGGVDNSQDVDYNWGDTGIVEPKLDYNLVKDYVIDIESRTGIELSKNQVEELKNALRNKEYTKLTPKKTAKHRYQFKKVKNSLISEWETNTGQKWPTYTEDVISPNTGEVLRKMGDKYDAHHVIENSFGGEHEWWNIHPAKFPDEHQSGIHRAGSPASELFKGEKK